MVIHWDPMPREEWNGPEFQYMVQYKPADEGDNYPWIVANVTDPYADQFVVSDVEVREFLEPGSGPAGSRLFLNSSLV